jgi:hypothetical protein
MLTEGLINHIKLRRPREVWGVDSGAGKLVVRPEKRVTARSNPPQKKCTGPTFPMNPEQKSLNTQSASTKMCQNQFAYFGLMLSA